MKSPSTWKTMARWYDDEGGVHMADLQNQASKADVQSTELNILPAEGEMDTEISAEKAAEVFEQNQASAGSSQNRE